MPTADFECNAFLLRPAGDFIRTGDVYLVVMLDGPHKGRTKSYEPSEVTLAAAFESTMGACRTNAGGETPLIQSVVVHTLRRSL